MKFVKWRFQSLIVKNINFFKRHFCLHLCSVKSHLVCQPDGNIYRGLVSVGAVGAATPTEFRKNWFCTHKYWKIWLLSCHRLCKCRYSTFFEANSKLCTHISEILTRPSSTIKLIRLCIFSLLSVEKYTTTIALYYEFSVGVYFPCSL